MFFAPTVLALTVPALGNHVKILCLSSGKCLYLLVIRRKGLTTDSISIGDADGLGETRKKELKKSGMLLGLRKEDDVFVVESPYVAHLAKVTATLRRANTSTSETFRTE
jgi:N-acetylglucosaminylphosphatidylinositol deacetylase